MITPEELTKALSDQTRLRILILLTKVEELCVCQLTEALEMIQPKISRHLAVLREKEILLDQRKDQWIFYSLHPALADWCLQTITALASGAENLQPYQTDIAKIRSSSLPTGLCN